MTKTRLILLMAVAFLSTFSSFAQNYLIYGAYDGSQQQSFVGSTRKENYDVAVHITESDLKGTTVKGVRIPVISLEGISNMSAWISDKLTVSNSVNVPSVTSQKVDVAQATITGGYIEVIFDQPYRLTDQGVYVGYSFDIETIVAENEKPIVSVPGNNPEWSYMRTSKTYPTWKSRNTSLNFTSAMQVLLTDGVKNGVTASLPEKNIQVNRSETYVFDIFNKGNNGVSSVDFTWSVAGKEGNVHATANIPAYYGKKGSVSFELPAIDAAGKHQLSIQINKVNGVDNELKQPFTTDLMNYAVIPVHRPLVEEYTGTTCGYCPRGLVGMDKMNRMFGNDFVGVSYHQYASVDPMDFGYIYSNPVSGYPIVYLDRSVETDPYLGNETSGFHFDEVWKSVRDQFSPVGVDLTAQFTDEAQTVIAVKSVTSAAYDMPGNYRLTYILTGDSLVGKGNQWGQTNYFVEKTGSYPDPDMSKYTGGSDIELNMVYNDVALAWSEEAVEQRQYEVQGNMLTYNIHDSGIEGSLPETLSASQPAEHSYVFDIAANKVVQKKDKLSVVVAIVDYDTRKIINANKVLVRPYSATGISDLESQEPMKVTKSYYSIDGKRLDMPQKGINIVRTSDGKTFKVYVR